MIHKQFESDGIVTFPSALADIDEDQLLEEVLTSIENGRVETWEKNLRVQTLMKETPEALKVLNRIRGYAEEIGGEAYKKNDTKQLREFASLTGYPGCKAQCWHRDSTEKRAVMMTGFMNIFSTTKENGSLQVVQGTHKNIKWLEAINSSNVVTIELPEKSLTFIDSRLIHRGGANRSKREIRPIVYASFGQGDLNDPGYFIHCDLIGKHSLHSKSEID